MFLGFYLVTIWRSWILLQRLQPDDPPWFGDAARMTIASLCGFGIAAQFVSLEALEIPYYVALLGAGTLAVHSRYESVRVPEVKSLEPVALPDWRDAINGDSKAQQSPEREPLLIMN